MQSVLWILVTGSVVAVTGALAGRDAVHAARNRTLWERAYWTAAGCWASAQTEITARFAQSPDARIRAALWRTLAREFAAWLPPDASCDFHIQAAGTRIDVNAADSLLLRRALIAAGHASEADALADALLDWRDADDDPRPNGAEWPSYRADSAMLPRNGPLAHVDELRRVRGFAGVPEAEALFSTEPGRIAINDASYAVLLALPGFGDEAARHVIALREQERPVTNLLDFAAELSVEGRNQLIAEFDGLGRVATVDPDAWIVTVSARAAPVHATIEVRLILAADRPAGIRQRIWEPMRLGISITADRVAAVLWRKRGVRWAQSFPLNGVDLREALQQLLAAAPRRRGTRVDVVASFGPSLVQFKPLHGLPAVATTAIAAQVVLENSARFFLRRASRIVTGRPSLVQGVWWGAAFDADAVAALTDACTAAGVRLGGCVPAVCVHGRIVPDGAATLADGAARVTATYVRGTCVRIQVQRPCEVGGCDRDTRVPDLQGVQADQIHAYGAACGPVPTVHVVAAWRDVARPRRQRRLRIAAAALIVVMAGVSAVAPGVLLARAAARDTAAGASLRRAFRQTLQAYRGNAAAAEDQKRVTAFVASRVPVTALVAHIAEVLPDSSALAVLRVDSAGGTVIAVAPPSRSIVAPLTQVPEIASLRIVGAMTRETIAGAPFQRTSLSFRGRWAPMPSHDRGAPR